MLGITGEVVAQLPCCGGSEKESLDVQVESAEDGR